ncbi:hypothetical protein EPN15_05245 [Patescibacteria group bacterium]|nr:MAG: hypothetical protein EPN15_05245 [Patescibacteria group bacterium]
MENQTSNNDQLVKFIQYFIFSQLVLLLYFTAVPIIATFRMSASVGYVISAIILILLFVAGLGIRWQRRWSIILYWIFIAIIIISPFFPLLINNIVSLFNYSIMVLNIAAATYLSFNQWKNWG